MEISVGHTPDADDAFMFYPLAKEIISVEGYRIEHVLEEIQALNQRAKTGDLEVTAISAAVYPQFTKNKHPQTTSTDNVGKSRRLSLCHPPPICS